MKNRNVMSFGRDYKLTGALSTPKGAGDQQFKQAVVILGMGIAELQIARRLRRLGMLAFQVRLIEQHESFRDSALRRAIYDDTGVARIQESMDFLSKNYGVEEFFLMGTCGGANVSLNAALKDPRVVGLIPVNLHFSEILTQDVVIKQKLINVKKWKKLFKRVITGKSSKWLRKYLLSKLKRATPAEMAAQWDWHKDMVVPLDLDNRLRELTQRGVSILMVYAHTEDSLAYLKKTYDKALEELTAGDRFALKVITRDTHIFSSDEESARILNDLVHDWFKNQVTVQA